MKLVAWIGVNHECIVSIEPGSGRSLWGAGDRCERNTQKLVEREGEVGGRALLFVGNLGGIFFNPDAGLKGEIKGRQFVYEYVCD